MSIYGAINSATTGLDAQSKALENISGNVANSSTVGYKRLDTSFSDLVAGNGSRQSEQVSGTVMATSQATNYLTGDIQPADRSTYMAIKGPGYFLVTNQDGLTQQPPESFYTRAGDFKLNTDRYLVNTAGYFLQGYPINPATGAVGDRAEPINISSAQMPAQASTQFEYKANLPSTPSTNRFDQNIPNSQYVDLSVFGKAHEQSTPVLTDGTTLLTASQKLSEATQFNDDDEIKFKLGDASEVTFTVGDMTVQELLDKLNGMHGVTASLETSGAIKISSLDKLTIDQDAKTAPPPSPGAVIDLDFAPKPLETGGTVNRNVVTKDKEYDFLQSTLSGGEETLYDKNGTPVGVELRWALNAENNWTLYYQSDPKATGNDVAWKAISDMTFDAAGVLTSPASGVVEIPNLSVNGLDLGSIDFKFGANITQYEGKVSGSQISDREISQNGFAAGLFQDISIDRDGNVVARYSNDKSQKLYKIPIATFSAEHELQRVDGAAFSETPSSGEASFRGGGEIQGKALESSNADIAKEFSKLIITQQAYSANSKVLSTANQMLDSVLNIVR